MKKAILLLQISLCFFACKKTEVVEQQVSSSSDLIEYAKGLQIEKYDGFYVMHVTTPWPNAEKGFQYVLAKSIDLVPDSLKNVSYIQIPIQKIIPTSTTHISSIVLLNEENSTVAFPHLDYISSPKVRSLIDEGKIKEVADKDEVNFELTLDLDPDVVVAHSMQANNPKFDQLEKAGIPIIYNGDWVEQTPLGKAEWIKFFGVLYDRYDESKIFFDQVVKEYNTTKELIANVIHEPTVMSGAIYQDIWYAPQGESWMAQFIKDAKGNYLWANASGTGSLSLSFEEVFEKAQNATYWIGPGQFESFVDLQNANKHYTEFSAFQNKKVYSYAIKKGAKGGSIFYEDAPNRPDLILKDLVYILHPEVLKNYQPNFIQALQ